MRLSEQQAGVVFAPVAFHEMARGFNEFATLIAATLGPQRGHVLHADGSRVEILADSGVIARRVVELPTRLHNAGAMQLRHVVWRMHERFGDGGATAAVLANAMVARAAVLLAAGADPVGLRAGMTAAVDIATRALDAQRLTIEPAEAAARLVPAVLADPDIAAVVTEMVEIHGPAAAIHLEVMASPFLDRVYVEGGYWKAQPNARATLPPGQNELVLTAPRLLVADDVTFEAADLLPVLDLHAPMVPRAPLVIVGAKFASRARELLDTNIGRGVIEAYAVSPGESGIAHHQILADIALVAGAELVSETRGFPPRQITPSWFGAARRAVLSRDSFTIVEGAGNRVALEDRVREIRERIARETDAAELRRSRQRLASLTGGVGILRIGGLTQGERDNKRRLVERALRVLPDLLNDGLAPGGGLAYLACRPAVAAFGQTLEPGDTRSGVELVTDALEAPFLRLVYNAGSRSPRVALQRVTDAHNSLAFDARTGELGPAADLALADSLAVLRGALQIAASAAAELMTTGAVVLPREHKRAVSREP